MSVNESLENAAHLTLRGKTLALSSEPETVYLGLPELYDEQAQCSVPLFVKSSQSKTWQAMTAQTQGVYQLAWQNAEGEMEELASCAILPESFVIYSHAETHSIDVLHSGRAYLSCHSPLLSGIHVITDGRCIELSSEQELPDTLDVVLRWSGNTEKLVIHLALIHELSPLSVVETYTEMSNLTAARAVEDATLRHLCIRHLLKQLSRHFAHEDWHTVLNLPLSDTEFWQLAKQENRVLVALLLQLDTAFMQQLTEQYSICWELISLKNWLIVCGRYQRYLMTFFSHDDVEEQLIKRIDKLPALSTNLSVVAQLLKCWLMQQLDDELLFMASEQAELLIKELLHDEQEQLNLRHANGTWLTTLRTELLIAWRDVSKRTQHLLSLDHHGDHHAVLLLPLWTAYSALTSDVHWQEQAEQLKQLKHFDDAWFNTAYPLVLAYLSQQEDAQQLLKASFALIDDAENDLLAEIEQGLAQQNTRTQSAQHAETLIPTEHDTETLRSENEQLLAKVAQLSRILEQRDAALQGLLTEIKTLNTHIQALRQAVTTH